MQYGSIGWSVGAVLGMAAALNEEKRRVLALIGDGSFQMTAQEVSTAIRNGLNPIIVLVNNYGYTIEVEIHDGETSHLSLSSSLIIETDICASLLLLSRRPLQQHPELGLCQGQCFLKRQPSQLKTLSLFLTLTHLFFLLPLGCGRIRDREG